MEGVLVRRGDVAGQRELADNGVRSAQRSLTKLLGEQAAVEALKDRVHATYPGAAEALIKLYQTNQRNGCVELDVNAEPRIVTRESS